MPLLTLSLVPLNMGKEGVAFFLLFSFMDLMNDQNEGFLDLIGNWFSGWKFPSLALFILVFFPLLLVVILLFPESESTMGQFAKDFKVWCFGYKPETGEIEWVYVVMLIMDPLLIVGIIVAIWKQQLIGVWRNNPLDLLPYAIFSFVLVLGGGIFLTVIADVNASESSLDFPGERIRTSIPAMDFKLTDHRQKEIRLSDYKGKVVVITSFYSSCGKTCPKVLMQLRKVMQKIANPDLDSLVVMPITMDPENDTREQILKTAASHKMENLPYHFLNGKPSDVSKILDQYGFVRTIDPITGEIDHANLFIVIDKQQTIAYRFSLGESQEKWLLASLNQLIHERE